MKKKFIVCSDTHFYGPHQMYVGLLRYGPNVIYSGDIWDFKNCRKKDLKKIEKDYELHLNECIATHTVIATGNHELTKICQYAFLFDGHKKIALVIHGDLLDYGADKMEKWRNKKPGISGLKWHLMKLFLGKRKGRKKELGLETLIRASRLAKKHNVNTIILGHYHVSKIFDKVFDGVRIIGVPRGISGIELDCVS